MRSTGSKIKDWCWIKECNPSNTDFIRDPWLFDVPIAFKLTFVNIHIHLDEVDVIDCVGQPTVNHDVCIILFGENVDWSRLCNWSLNREGINYWV